MAATPPHAEWAEFQRAVVEALRCEMAALGEDLKQGVRQVIAASLSPQHRPLAWDDRPQTFLPTPPARSPATSRPSPAGREHHAWNSSKLMGLEKQPLKRSLSCSLGDGRASKSSQRRGSTGDKPLHQRRCSTGDEPQSPRGGGELAFDLPDAPPPRDEGEAPRRNILPPLKRPSLQGEAACVHVDSTSSTQLPGMATDDTADVSGPPVRSTHSIISRSSTISKKSLQETPPPALSMWDMMMGPDQEDIHQGGGGQHPAMTTLQELPEIPIAARTSQKSRPSKKTVAQDEQLAWVIPTESDTPKQDKVSVNPVRYTLSRISRCLAASRRCISAACSTSWADLLQWPPGSCSGSLHGVVDSTPFTFFIAAMIVVHAASVGVQTEYDIRHLQENTHPAFRIIDMTFCVVFCLELCLRIACYGWGFFTMPSEWRWNIFDTVIIGFQLFDEIAIITSGGWRASTVPGNFLIMRIAWLSRLIRNARLLRLLRFFQEFRTMFDSIASSAKPLASLIILLVLMIYTYGICFTNLVIESARDQPEILLGEKGLGQYYGSLARSLLSLFQATTGGVDWNDLLRPLQEDISPLMAIPFGIYIAFMILAMTNVITGVFVESALSAARGSKDIELRNQMRVLIQTTDRDHSGMISWEEFADQLEEQDLVRCFQLLDIDISEAKGLFTLLDTDCLGEIDAEEFVMGCLRLKGNAKAIDLATLMYFNKRMATWWQTQMSTVHNNLHEIIRLVGTERECDVHPHRASFAASSKGCRASLSSIDARMRNRRCSESSMGSSIDSLAAFATWDGLKAECSGGVRKENPSGSRRNTRLMTCPPLGNQSE